jgi:hypothetical protein
MNTLYTHTATMQLYNKNKMWITCPYTKIKQYGAVNSIEQYTKKDCFPFPVQQTIYIHTHYLTL